MPDRTPEINAVKLKSHSEVERVETDSSGGYSQTEADDDFTVVELKQSAVAKEIVRLRSTASTLMAQRGKLPQPLFWSLFHSQIEEIKKKKRLERLLDSVLGGLK